MPDQQNHEQAAAVSVADDVRQPLSHFQPVPKQLNSTGLPDNLKSGIEHISGFSMDDVRVHYNSDKPNQLKAFAYAQGSNIHVAPGQEKHLPHEAWHVVQQKQGRVQATNQAGSRPINDDPVLETEADVMGSKADLLPFVTPFAAEKQMASASGPVQRKVGLEFQTATDVWRQGEESDEENAAPPVKTKLPYGDKIFSAPGFHIESDDGQVEFVTAPFEEDAGGLTGLVKAVQMMAQFANLIYQHWDEEQQPSLLSAIANAFGTGTYDSNRGEDEQVYMGNFEHPSNEPNVNASPQASVGIPLDSVIRLMQVLSANNEKGQKLGGFGNYGHAQPALHKSQEVIKRTLATKIKKDSKELEALAEYRGLKNFVALVIHYLQGADAYAADLAREGNYPKMAHPMMSRTNFRQIFGMMSVAENRLFVELFTPEKLVNLAKIRMGPDDRIYPEGYRDEENVLQRDSAPTIREWIASFNDLLVREPDKLSRLPHMQKGRGMGALAVKDKVAKTNTRGEAQKPKSAIVFELRRMATNVPPEEWANLAMLVHAAVNEINKAQAVTLDEDAMAAINAEIENDRGANDAEAGELEDNMAEGVYPEYDE
ncbi:MAG: DUF4157 domain-containing protein [Bacteroidetes bacterium]|nr:DUF4157 domain-containing protein [Bacteroidota bacterium]